MFTAELQSMPGNHFFSFLKYNFTFFPIINDFTFIVAKFHLFQSLHFPNFPLKQIRKSPLKMSGVLPLFLMTSFWEPSSWVPGSWFLSSLLWKYHPGLPFIFILWVLLPSPVCWRPCLPLSSLTLLWKSRSSRSFLGYLECLKYLYFTYNTWWIVWVET